MKAQKLIELCINESGTSGDGKTEHSHPEILDDNGVLVDLGPASSGQVHKHGIVISDQGDISIEAALKSDPTDPSHDHEPSEGVVKSTKDAYLKSFDKDDEWAQLRVRMIARQVKNFIIYSSSKSLNL